MKNLTTELLNGYVNGLESEAKKAVFEILDINEIEDVFNYGCVSGCAGGFVYYHQTEEFFNEYPDEVLECLQNYMRECWLVSQGFEFELTRNNLTWLFVDQTVYEMVNELGLEW